MFKKHKFLVLGFLIGTALTAMPEAQAFSSLPTIQTIQPTTQAAAADTGLIQLARNQGERRRVQTWDRRMHGDRCRYRNGGCRYYRNGWYYRSPWWTLPLVIPGAVIGSALNDGYDDGIYAGRRGSRHVAWCEDRYRSYNARTNTWISYSGEERECNSPYN
jgi:BA14K-like protein